MATDGSVEVRFGIELDATGIICEPNGDFEAARPEQFSLEDLYGQIELRHGDASVIIKDEILHLAWKACLDVADRLAAAQSSNVRLYLRPLKIQFEPAGDVTKVTFADEAVGDFPTLELAQALVQCCQRLAKTMNQLAAGDAGIQEVAQALEKRAKEVEQTVSGAA